MAKRRSHRNIGPPSAEKRRRTESKPHQLRGAEAKYDSSTRIPERNPRAHEDYIVGWICAIPEEQTAAVAMLDERHTALPKLLNDQNVYTLGSIDHHNIVITCLPKGKPGTISAATVVTRMVNAFPSIKFGLMVGIGSGIPQSVRLGDVVVSTPVDQYPGVVQYDMGNAETGGKFQRTGSLNNPPTSLLTAITKLETESQLEGSKIPRYLQELGAKYPRLASKYLRSNSLKDVLFRADSLHIDDKRGNEEGEEEENCPNCDKAQIIKRKPREMFVHYGLIASGGQVIKDGQLRDKINSSLGGKVLCLEREAAGLMANFPCIVIRGICDYADSHKNNNWQEHAAAVAAAFAKELLMYVQPNDIDREKRARDTLGRLSETVSKIEDHLAHRRSQFDGKEDLRILNWLTPVDYGPQQSDSFRQRQPGTGQWLLDSEEYQTWLATEKATLFCPGIPGAGKTVLTSIVVKNLESTFEHDATIGIAYIYLNFRRKDDQKTENIFSSILKQLAQNQHSLHSNMKSLYDRHATKFTRPTSDEICEVLESVISVYSRVFIVIDALDECEASGGGREQFLAKLFGLQAITHGSISIFATSRLIPEIMDKFSNSLILKINASKDDISKYLDGHFSTLPSFVARNINLQSRIKTSIINAVDGMFLLAKLHLDSLVGKMTPKAMQNALENLATGSDAYDIAYKDAMERITGQVTDKEHLAKRVISWITCAERALTTQELQHALAVEINEPKLDEFNLLQIEDILSVCAGLVTVDEKSSIIRLVHYTAQEYFQRTQGKWFSEPEIDITTTCINYLSFRTFESGCVQSDEEFQDRLRIHPFYLYASQNWGYHARRAQNHQEITLFLKQQAVVEASCQALLVTFPYRSIFAWGQGPPQKMTGLHLAAYFGLEKAAKVLCSRYDADVNAKNSQGRTPLSYAAERGHITTVKLLFDNGADIEAEDGRYGQNSLFWAALGGHEAIVKLLLEKGADTEAKDEFERTPLLLAAEKGHNAIAKFLLEKGAIIEAKDNIDGQTPLLLATSRGHEAIVKLLLKNGADIEAKDDRFHRTPLLLAAEKGHNTIAKLLLEKGATIQAKDNYYGQNPLSMACWEGHEAIVKLLLVKGADIEARDNRCGRTPLSWATLGGHEAIVKLLLEKDVNIEAKDNDYGQTPLSWAVLGGYEAIAKLLLNNGADIEAKGNKYDQAPLWLAATGGKEAIAKLLLDNGAKIEAKDKEYVQTPLSMAALGGHEAVAKLLLAKGANTEARANEFGLTPLWVAAGEGHEAIVKLLLKNGADIETEDDVFGRPPLRWAALEGDEDIVKLILERALFNASSSSSS